MDENFKNCKEWTKLIAKVKKIKKTNKVMQHHNVDIEHKWLSQNNISQNIDLDFENKKNNEHHYFIQKSIPDSKAHECNYADNQSKFIKIGHDKCIPKSTIKNIRSGKYPIENTMDCHGLRYSEARSAVISFINLSYHSNFKLIKIITGVGKTKENSGIIKKSIEGWINDCPNFAKKIKYIDWCSKMHGGEGAIYIFFGKNK